MNHSWWQALSALLAACASAFLTQQPRNELLRSSSWLTYGDGHRPLRSAAGSASRKLDHFVHPHILRQLKHGHVQDVVVRQADGAVPATPQPQTSTVITGAGNRSTFNCTVVNIPRGLNVNAAITRTLAIVENTWPSTQTVQMRVAFTNLGGKDVLANGGGTFFVNMGDLFDTALPIAAAESARGLNLNENDSQLGQFDVLVTVNENADWYTGVDGKPASKQYDLITVLLHEIYHSLIFAGGLTVDVRRNSSLSGGISQSARLQNNFVTRFDSFLANKQNCQVLGYREETERASNLKKSTEQLLADALTNDELYFAYQAFAPIAQLYAPRVFIPRSSIYHLEPKNLRGADLLMAPTIRRGTRIDTIGPVILNMQRVFLDPKIKGANPNCPRPLLDPTPLKLPRDNDRTGPIHPGPKPITSVRRIGGLRVWVFALIVSLSILIGFILLVLWMFCLLACVKALRVGRVIVLA